MLRCWGLKADADQLDAITDNGREARTERALEIFAERKPKKKTKIIERI